MTATIPKFPRLREEVRARQYMHGTSRDIVLHTPSSDDVLVLGRDAWSVLACADGTRTIEGLALAAHALGVRPRHDAVERLLQALADRALLADGPPAQREVLPGRRDGTNATGGARPVVSVPGYRWACDGRGGCCSLFASVLMTRREVYGIRAHIDEFPLGELPPEEVFLPARGSVPQALFVPTLRDGACCFLQRDGGCGVHARLGELAKPSGCRQYPTTLVDDGEAIHASVLTECACTLREPPVGANEPVAGDESVRTEADIPESVALDVLPDTLAWADAQTVPRAVLRDWIAARFAERWPDDLAAWLWSMARALEPEPESPEVAIHALADLCEARARREAPWRRSPEASMIALQWIAKAALLAGQSGRFAAAPASSSEVRYLRAAFWGYVDAARGPWSWWLRERAVRIWVARMMATVRGESHEHPMFDEPLAIIDALLRSRDIRLEPHGAKSKTHARAGRP